MVCKIVFELLLIIISTSVNGQSSLNCDKEVINTCIAPLINGPFDNMNILGTPVNASVVQNTCSQLAAASKCVMDAASNCTKYDLANANDLIESIRFLCNEGNAGLTKFQTCMTDPIKIQMFQNTLYTCYSYVSTFVPDPSINGQICKQYNGVYSCYVNASKICDSMDFVVTYFQKYNSKLSLNYYCNLNYSNWNTTQVYSECNTTKLLTTCISGLTQVTSTIFPFNPNLLSLSDSTLNTICSSHTTAIDCVQNKAKCGTEVMYMPQVAGLLNATNYLCNIDRNGFSNLMKCVLMNPMVFMVCLNIEITDCRSINSQHRCLVDAAKKSCGDNSFVQNLYFFSIQSMLDSNCQLSLPFKNSSMTDGQGSAKCNMDVIEACLAPYRNGPFDNMNLVGSPVNASVLQMTCAQIAGVSKCVMDAASNCSKFDLATANDIVQSIRYVCNEGYSGITKFQSCLTDPSKFENYFSNLYSCNSYLSNFVPDLSINGQICKQNNGMYSCLVNASKVCDSEDFVMNYYKKTNSKLSLIYNCNLNYSNWNTTQVYSECNTTKLLTMCVPSLSSMTSQIFPINPNLFSLSDSALNAICSSYATAMDCARNQAKCVTELMTMPQVASLFNATNYLCNINRYGFNNLIKCVLMNPMAFTICHKIAITDCRSMNSQHSCFIDVAKKNCGDDAFVQNIYYYSIQPMLPPNCQLSCSPVHCGVFCGYGYKTDQNRCSICECVKPCETKVCPANYVCKIEDTLCNTPCVPVTNCYPKRV